MFDLEIVIRSPYQILDREIVIWSADRVCDLEILIRSADRILDLEILIGSADRIQFIWYFSFKMRKNLRIKISSFDTFCLIWKVEQNAPFELRQSSDCRLTRKSMQENFPVYLRTYPDNHSLIFEELLQYRFTKKHIYSANTVCNFESMKSPMELNNLFSKLFCYITWFVISPD